MGCPSYVFSLVEPPCLAAGSRATSVMGLVNPWELTTDRGGFGQRSLVIQAANKKTEDASSPSCSKMGTAVSQEGLCGSL